MLGIKREATGKIDDEDFLEMVQGDNGFWLVTTTLGRWLKQCMLGGLAISSFREMSGSSFIVRVLASE